MSGSHLRRIIRSGGMIGALFCVACTTTDSTEADSTTGHVKSETLSAERGETGPAVGDREEATRTTRPDRTAAAKVETCRVRMPETWRKRLQLPEERAGESYATLIAADADGNRFDAQYGEAQPGEPSPVLFLWTRNDGASRIVMDLRESVGQQVFAGDFDGRYLAFSIYENSELFSSPWVGYVWDMQNPEPPREFARSTAETYSDGTPGSLPLMYPLIRDGTVYWVAYDPTDHDNSDRTLFAYDIADDSTRPVATGKFNTPHFLGDSILSISQSDDGNESSIVQVPLDAQAPGPLLADEITRWAGVKELAASGKSMAWIAENQIFLLASEYGQVVTLVGPDGTFGDEKLHEPATIDLNDDAVLFYARNSDDSVQQYVFDRRSKSFFSNEDLEGASADFAADENLLSLHHTNAAGSKLVGRPILAPMNDLPPLPACP